LEGDERWARVAWAFLAEPRDVEVTRQLGAVGAVEALARLRTGRFVGATGGGLRGSAGRDGLDVRLPELDLDDLAHAARASRVRVLVPGDDEWPAGLDRLAHPPYCLFVRGAGSLAELVERSVAVVGSRAATEYGMRVAADLGEGLAGRGFTVVSGAAYGIDSAAHRAALAADGPTVAVLACGADRAYPLAHRGLIDRVAASGAVVSEVPVGCAPYRSRFLARNRVIAALARATVVVEANLRSGSLTTAKEARLLHLPVGAVPGPVTSMTSAGCHSLVRETDAVLVTDAAEVAELAARIGEDLVPVGGSRSVEVRPGDDLDEEAYRVWSAVPMRGGVSVDRLASACGVEVRRVVGILATLEAEGIVRREAGRWRKKPAPSGRFAG
jgi:DNA processing protein